MSTQILRPIFSENQILSAADVNSIVNHARDARSRHNRYLHSWGIAEGLQLQTEDLQDSSGTYLEVNVTPGVAIDGNGREIVVPEAFRLSEDIFDQLNVAESVTDPNNPPKYPVFLLGRDKRQQDSAMKQSTCFGNEPTRTLEGYDYTFGRVGTAAELDNQSSLSPDQEISASANGNGNGNWKILLGFVEWDGNHFSAIAEEDGGIGPRYAGVRAEDVSAQNDRLILRSADRNISDKAALELDNENGGEMHFGLQDSKGQVVPVFTVNAKGDVIAKGKILGAIAGGVQVESGVINDGALVPLPAGITQQQLDSGEASIQVHLSPRYQQPASLPPLATNEYWLMQPLECYVQDRRVVCRVRWESTNNASGPFVLPGVCDYQVFGFVKK